MASTVEKNYKTSAATNKQTNKKKKKKGGGEGQKNNQQNNNNNITAHKPKQNKARHPFLPFKNYKQLSRNNKQTKTRHN
jgi:hypothetical protein